MAPTSTATGGAEFHPGSAELLVGDLQIVDEEAEVGVAGVVRVHVDDLPPRLHVLEELQDVVGARDPQLGPIDDAVGEGHNGAEIPVGDLAPPDDLAAEKVAVELERALQVGDGVAGMMDPADPHVFSSGSG